MQRGCAHLFPSGAQTAFAKFETLVSHSGGKRENTRRASITGVTFTLADGLVLARSVFNHSMNYRSAVALGSASIVDEPGEKLEALRAFTEKILPGRWNDARQPNEKELKATSILRLPLTEISAKVRTGGVEDDAEDYALPVWAGVVPLRLVADTPLRDERCDPALSTPAYATTP